VRKGYFRGLEFLFVIGSVTLSNADEANGQKKDAGKNYLFHDHLI
jgi:hypothetical protein